MLYVNEYRCAFYCGIWQSPHRLAAALVDVRGALLGRYSTDRTPSDLWNLLADIEGHHGLDGYFLLSDELLLGSRAFAHVAIQRGCQLLTVPGVLVQQMQVLSGASGRVTPKQLALVMARLPLCEPVRHRIAPWPPVFDDDIL